jgi:hypothetical protein
MTQSKKDDNTIVLTNTDGTTSIINLDDIIDTTGDITISLNDTYGATTTYLNGASDSYTISLDDTITISDGTYTLDTHAIDWNNITITPTMWEDCMPDPQKLKKMCEQYPALAKVYENFRTVYSMVEQDWKGNYEDDNDIPF